MAAFRVEVAGGLVGEDEVWLGDQCASDGNPLLLPAGKLRGPVPGSLAEPELRQERVGAPERVFLIAPGDQKRHGNVLRSGELRQEMMKLKDKPDALVPKPVPSVLVQGKHILPPEKNGPRVRNIERPEKMHEGALPNPGSPHDSNHLSLVNCNIDPPKDFYTLFVGPVALSESCRPNQLSHNQGSALQHNANVLMVDG